MDTTDVLTITAKYADAVLVKYNLKRIFLVGDHANGSSVDGADINIALIFEDHENLLEVQLSLIRLRRKVDNRIVPHPFHEKTFNSANPEAVEILRLGKEVPISRN